MKARRHDAAKENAMPFALPPLPYDHDALEPVISAPTLKLHHGAHHRGYVDKLNAAVRGTELEGLALEAVVRRAALSGAAGVFNNAAQAWNHAFFWRSLRPKAQAGAPGGALAARLESEFGGYGRFVEAFKLAALGVFGSGWAWLVEHGGALEIVTTSNADTPIVRGQTPLLVVDVWEHAYYLDHQNRRDLYVSGVVDHLLNWDFAQRNLAAEPLATA
jgi:Fe-Mn family superoxide dismutase